MLADFIAENRDEIIARTRAMISARTAPVATEVELTNGIPVFLDQLGAALRLMKATGQTDHSSIASTAGKHGLDLFGMGLTIGQVVYDYGNVCQAVTELALEHDAPIRGDEFRTLNLCLDDAIASAVTEYSAQHERSRVDTGSERLGALAHELRNVLNTAFLSFESIKGGIVPAGGSTALLHGRSLLRLRDLIDRSLADVRLEAGIYHPARIAVAALVEEVGITAVAQAHARGIQFAAATTAQDVTVDADRQILAAALSNRTCLPQRPAA